MMYKSQFVQIPHSWFGLVQPCDLSFEDIGLLGIINSLDKTAYGCIANDSYLQDVLKVNNIRFNIARLEKAGLIKITNGKVRKITLNKEVLKKYNAI